MDKDQKQEQIRKLKLVERYDNDDYSRFAGPDYTENNFEIGEDDRMDFDNVIGHHVWDSGIRDEEEESDHGEFFGYGPKGYKRKDERIYEDVCELLMRHRAIDATHIAVTVQEGVVNLSGRVESRRMKKLAERILEDLPGVTDIENELNVISGDHDPRGPSGVTKKDLGLT